MKILLVDDARAIHFFVKDMLKNSGFEVSSCMDGQECVDLLKTDASFDVILLDWEMPRLNGIETLEAVRNMGVEIPIVMTTSKNAQDDIMQALAKGANEYIMKPFTKDVLSEKFMMMFGKEVA